MFTGETFVRFLEARRIKLLNSSPYYAQANGQAEEMNKVIINLIKRHIRKHPKKWHEKLSEVLWAYRTTIKTATGVTPFRLVYGHEAVLPAEIMIPSLRIERQNDLSGQEYELLMDEGLNEACEIRQKTLEYIRTYQSQVQKVYNKRVKAKSLSVGDLVSKPALPIGEKSRLYGKWSPN